MKLPSRLGINREFDDSKLFNRSNETTSLCERLKATDTSDSGKLCLSLRYGAKVVEIAKGKTGVELPNDKELVATLEILKQAVESGELDTQIEAVAGAVKSGFRK